jgi:hypothetical protein
MLYVILCYMYYVICYIILTNNFNWTEVTARKTAHKSQTNKLANFLLRVKLVIHARPSFVVNI